MIQTDAPRRELAVVRVPPRQSLDGHYASCCVAYVLDRGYLLVAVIRDWADIDRMLRRRQVTIVVVAQGEHWAGELAEEADMITVTDLGRYRDKVATRPIQRVSHDATDRLRRILDGYEAAPCGVAPETVAALRLIWWRLGH